MTCGATLTTNTVLTRNLTCPSGNGLTLGAGVTLDLGGRTLTGPGSSGTGVVFSGAGGSALINGTVRGWQDGVTEDVDSQVVPSSIRGVRFDKARLSFTNSSPTLTGVRLTDSPVIQFQGHLVVQDSTLTRSTVKGYGASVAVSGSTIRGGGVEQSDGWSVSIESSTLDGSGYDGPPTTCWESDILVRASTVRNYVRPISPLGCSVSLQGNTFTDNRNGVMTEAGMEDGPGNAVVDGNTFRGNGIALHSSSMTVTGNTFVANTTGVLAERPETVTITGNTFSRNTSSGIRTLADGLTVGANTATNNGRYGIYAPNAHDLGGNRAYGNTLGDCVGLICAGRR
ncbi:hypothetical protein GCM10009818_03130 [Nakamurella flavida]